MGRASALGRVSGQAYSDGSRARVLGAVDRGGRVYEIAPLLEVGVAYICKALARRRLYGIVAALPKTGRPGRKLDRHLEALAAHGAANPDATLVGLVEWSRRARDVSVIVCVATMWAMIEALDLSVKKRHATPPGRSASTLPPPAMSGAKRKTA